MRRKMLSFPVYLVLLFLSVLLLLPNRAMAEGDGGWTTTASPGYVFQVEEDLFNNQKHLVMTVLKADETYEVHWGPASGSVGNTYLLESMNGKSDMKATWQFNSVTEATVTVESCSTNCLWQSGQVVTLKKFYGDIKSDGTEASRVPQTGQTMCWDGWGNDIPCAGSGMDGEIQAGIMPPYNPDMNDYGSWWRSWDYDGIRFTDNRDGTVTDNVSGLTWTRNANCAQGRLNWWHARAFCRRLAHGTCGLADGSSPSDWRLPNINELQSIQHLQYANPAIKPPNTIFNVQVTYRYWSNTLGPSWSETPFSPSYATMYTLSFSKAYDLDYSIFHDSYFTWCVRKQRWSLAR